jgi:hypothetical protein
LSAHICVDKLFKFSTSVAPEFSVLSWIVATALSLSPMAFCKAVRTGKVRTIDHLGKAQSIRSCARAEQLQ